MLYSFFAQDGNKYITRAPQGDGHWPESSRSMDDGESVNSFHMLEASDIIEAISVAVSPTDRI